MSVETQNLQTHPQSTIDSEPARSSSWVISLAFWGTLVVAAVLYAAVTLSPKLADFAQARTRFRNNAYRLVDLESEVDYLERVTTALKTDPNFAKQLAFASHQPASHNESLIPVTQQSTSDVDEEDPSPAPTADVPLWMKGVTYLAAHPDYRRWMLITSACLTLFAFTFLNDSERGSITRIAGLLRSAVLLPIQRYRIPEGRPIVPIGSEDAHQNSSNPSPPSIGTNQGQL